MNVFGCFGLSFLKSIGARPTRRTCPMKCEHLAAHRDTVQREGQGQLQDPESPVLFSVTGNTVLKVERTDRRSTICRGHLPLEGKYAYSTLPSIPPPFQSPSPYATTSLFRALARRNLRARPSDLGTNKPTCNTHSPGAISLARRPARLRRTYPSEGNSLRPAMPKTRPPPGSPFRAVGAGSLSYGTGRTTNRTA